MLRTTPERSSLLRKLLTCSIAGSTIAGTLLLLGNGGTIPWLPPTVIFPLTGMSLVTALVYPFVWHHKEKNNTINSESTYAFLCSVIRYGIAFSIACFGWKKIFGLQFIVPEEIASLPMNKQDGEWLTWYYFGYSALYGTIIAGMQIGGAILLLFRRTTLFGSILLFGVMLNLLLINICYSMNAGALIQSVTLTTGLLFLILSDHRRITEFFFKHETQYPEMVVKGPTLKYVLILSVILLSLIFTVHLRFRN
ncbi:hypothetical protein [Flavobacterium sp.]|uniref:hypothetical protein n=1 Tax=Flavobacterium sp. TaxID=239 RepID=UPI004033FBD5